MKPEKDMTEILNNEDYRRMQNLMVECWCLLRKIFTSGAALPAPLGRSLALLVDPPMALPENVEQLERRSWEMEAEQRRVADARYAELGIPDALLKARGDTFEYACGLRDGTVIYFAECTFPDDPADFHGWVHLDLVTSHTVRAVENSCMAEKGKCPFNFERGLDVHLSQIAWVADAPYGS